MGPSVEAQGVLLPCCLPVSRHAASRLHQRSDQGSPKEAASHAMASTSEGITLCWFKDWAGTWRCSARFALQLTAADLSYARCVFHPVDLALAVPQFSQLRCQAFKPKTVVQRQHYRNLAHDSIRGRTTTVCWREDVARVFPLPA